MTAIVRLGIRVRPDRAEMALAQLLPVLQAGAEERAGDGWVEYSLYAPPGELPSERDVRELVGDALIEVVLAPVAEGWERRWHEFLRPVRVGSLVVRPPWVEGSPEDLVIDPDVFFGAGTHPTTRLALSLLLELPAGGGLCDWGAGTGVLAVAAARRGFDPVVAVEVDPGALAAIRRNAALNRVSVTTKWLNLAATPAPWAPTVTANLTRDLLIDAAGLLERPPERLIASGMILAEADDVAAAFGRVGLVERQRRIEGEWAALHLEAGPREPAAGVAGADRQAGAGGAGS